MKTILKILTVLVMIYPQFLFAQNENSYFPHQIGDKWEWSSSARDTTYFQFISDTSKLSDGSIDVYFDSSNTPRYNIKPNGNVYQYFGDNTLEIWFDFSVAPKDTFYTTIYSAPYYVTVDSLEREMFGDLTKIRIFKWFSESNNVHMGEQKVSDKFGIYYKWSNFYPPSSSSIVGCTIDGIGYGTLVSVKDDSQLLTGFSLSQNYPNPFNPATTIVYNIPYSNHVTLEVYNILGQRIKKLVDELQYEGNYKITFDASELPSGVYIYRLKSGSYTASKKMLILK